MSRVGKKPVVIPQGLDYKLSEDSFEVKGKLGTMVVPIRKELVDVKNEESGISITPVNKTRLSRSMQGTMRALIANAVEGVSKGFQTELEIQGVGYKAAIKGANLVLNLGFSHEVVFKIPSDIKIECKGLIIHLSGVDKQRVVQTAADIKTFRPPEPYKGKGIRFKGQFVLRKEGKKK